MAALLGMILFLMPLTAQAQFKSAETSALESTRTVVPAISSENSFKLTSSLRFPVVSKEDHIMPMVGVAFSNMLTTLPLVYDAGFETMFFAHKFYGQLKYAIWYSPQVNVLTGVEADMILSNTDLVVGGFNLGPFIEAEFHDFGVQVATLGSRWDDFELSMRAVYRM